MSSNTHWDALHTTPFSVSKRHCFVPFSKRFASTLIVSVSFSPVHATTHIRIENALQPYILLYSPSILPPLLSSRQIRVVPLRWSSSWSYPEPSRFGGLRPSQLKSLAIFCSLLEKSKGRLNRVRNVSKTVKRPKITAINKETTWKRLSISDTHG